MSRILILLPALIPTLSACKDRRSPERAPPAAPASPTAPDAGTADVAERLQGVWREVSYIDTGRPVGLGWTHRVFDGSTVREWEDGTVVYEGDARSATTWSIDAASEPPTLTLEHRWVNAAGEVGPAYVERGAVRIDGDTLLIGWASDDELNTAFDPSTGDVETLVRETDAELVARASAPVVAIPHPTRDEPDLGRLEWNGNVRWWQGELVVDRGRRARLHIDGARDAPGATFDQARAIVERLRAGALATARTHAATALLDLYNTTWRGDRPRLDAAGFIAALTVESIGISDDGSVSLFFADGGMFLDHAVVVSLDHQLRPTDASIQG